MTGCIHVMAKANSVQQQFHAAGRKKKQRPAVRKRPCLLAESVWPRLAKRTPENAQHKSPEMASMQVCMHCGSYIAEVTLPTAILQSSMQPPAEPPGHPCPWSPNLWRRKPAKARSNVPPTMSWKAVSMGPPIADGPC